MTVNVRTGTVTALKHLLPGQIGPGRRWEEPFLYLLIDALDAEVREYTEASYKAYEITPSDGENEYELPDDCIEIYQVEWATDGSTYDTVLEAVTFDDLDTMSRLWRDDGGGKPCRYAVVSTPGVPTVPNISGTTESTIIIHPEVATVSSAMLRVRYLCTGGTTGVTNQFAIDNVYVPYMRALMTATSNDQKKAALADKFYSDYLSGLDRLRESAGHEYDHSLRGPR